MFAPWRARGGRGTGPAAQAGQDPQEASMTAVAPNVLIAENDDVSRLFLPDNLETDGYRPVCAAVTAAALELLSAALDALIVDVNGDTLGVIAAIRDQNRPTSTRIYRSSRSHRTATSCTGHGSWSAAPTTCSARRVRSRPSRPARGATAPRGRLPYARACSGPGRSGSTSGPAARGRRGRARPVARQGVSAAAYADRRARARVHPRGTAAQRLGARQLRPDTNA